MFGVSMVAPCNDDKDYCDFRTLELFSHASNLLSVKINFKLKAVNVIYFLPGLAPNNPVRPSEGDPPTRSGLQKRSRSVPRVPQKRYHNINQLFACPHSIRQPPTCCIFQTGEYLSLFNFSSTLEGKKSVREVTFLQVPVFIRYWTYFSHTLCSDVWTWIDACHALQGVNAGLWIRVICSGSGSDS